MTQLSTTKQKEDWWKRPVGKSGISIFVAVTAALIAWMIERHYDRPVIAPLQNVEHTGNGMTKGDQSPIITGNGNTINYVQPRDSSKRQATLPSGNETQAVGDKAAPKAEPEPKVVLSRQVGDLFLKIKECARTGGIGDDMVPDFPIRCVGTIENRGDVKVRVEFTNGRVVDDAGNEYKLWGSGPWGGVVANFSVGAGGCAEELVPDLPVKFAFWTDHVKREATSVNSMLDLIASGKPSPTEVVFKGIEIRDH